MNKSTSATKSEEDDSPSVPDQEVEAFVQEMHESTTGVKVETDDSRFIHIEDFSSEIHENH